MDAKLKVFSARVNQDLKDLWDKDRLFLITFGVIILFVKFRDLLISILLNSANRVQASAKKSDSKLASQENNANNEANALVEDAHNVAQDEAPVDSNWYKNEK